MKKRVLLLVGFLFLSLAFNIGIKQVSAGEIGAGTTYDLFDTFKLRNDSLVSSVYNKPSDLINLIVKLLFVAAGIVLFFMVIMAGFSMIKGDSKDKDKAKTTLTSALMGFIVMFAAYWIMQIIQLLTGMSIGF
jgi:hypothetical protein